MSIDTRTAELLGGLLPACQIDGKEDANGWTRIDLPAGKSADYSFTLHEDRGGENQISAKLLDGTCSGKSFWYWPMEQVDYKNDPEALLADYYKCVETILTHPTRIIYKKGLLFDSFRLEANKSGKWIRQYGMSSLRMGCGPGPTIRGRKHIYCSPSIVSK